MSAPQVINPTNRVICKLCKRVFQAPVALRVIPGAGDNTRLVNFIADLDTHLMKEHPDQANLCDLQAMQFVGLARLTYYTINDPEVADQNNFLRWSIHQATLNAKYTDTDLEAIAARLAGILVDDALEPELPPDGRAVTITEQLKVLAAGKIRTVLMEMRQQLQEPGRYTIQPATDPPN